MNYRNVLEDRVGRCGLELNLRWVGFVSGAFDNKGNVVSVEAHSLSLVTLIQFLTILLGFGDK